MECNNENCNNDVDWVDGELEEYCVECIELIIDYYKKFIDEENQSRN
jgi:hypothetical protein